MTEQSHHAMPEMEEEPNLHPPMPSAEPARWVEAFTRTFGDDGESRWGKRIVRLASDMVVVCDDEMKILYHNRAFLRGVGYQAGTFEGSSLLSFFPQSDLPEAERAFERLLSGRSAGMRIQASFMTQKGDRIFDARVTRSRRGTNAFFLYFVIRDETQREEEVAELKSQLIEPLLTGLPVAAFRTDRRLRVTKVFGELWADKFRCTPESLVGMDLSDADCEKTPLFLKQIDYCDTMAGLTLHTDFYYEEIGFEITVEPFLDEKKKVLGSIGMIRVAKKVASKAETDTLPFPTAKDHTAPIRSPRSLSISTPSMEEEISRIRESIQPRRMSAADVGTAGGEEDLVALSN